MIASICLPCLLHIHSQYARDAKEPNGFGSQAHASRLQLVSTCVGGPNGEKHATTCVREFDQSLHKLSQVHANQRKWVAKWNASRNASQKLGRRLAQTCVDLLSSFDQGLGFVYVDMCSSFCNPPPGVYGESCVLLTEASVKLWPNVNREIWQLRALQCSVLIGRE